MDRHPRIGGKLHALRSGGDGPETVADLDPSLPAGGRTVQRVLLADKILAAPVQRRVVCRLRVRIDIAPPHEDGNDRQHGKYDKL